MGVVETLPARTYSQRRRREETPFTPPRGERGGGASADWDLVERERAPRADLRHGRVTES